MDKLPHQQPAQWIALSARLGYAAKGTVYILVGILAFQAAINWGGEVTGSKGALQAIAFQPFGKVLLFLIAVGLLGYVFWRFIQAVYDPEHDDRGFGSFARRLSSLLSGLVYASLALFAFKIVFANVSESDSSSSEQTAIILSKPFGHWLVGGVGVAIIAYGFYCFYRAIATKFRRKLKLAEVSQATEKWATKLAQFGLSARGIVCVIIGYFLIQAAKTHDPDQTKTTEGALEVIQQQPYGAWLMGIIALGLIAYGSHLVFQARYRRISP